MKPWPRETNCTSQIAVDCARGSGFHCRVWCVQPLTLISAVCRITTSMFRWSPDYLTALGQFDAAGLCNAHVSFTLTAHSSSLLQRKRTAKLACAIKPLRR